MGFALRTPSYNIGDNKNMFNRDAWNKVEKTHDLFKKMVAPLKEHLGIDFGYMIVFNDGSYYQIIENLECLKKWVTNVETSSIFCARNVTTYFDEPYNFTIWPEEPTCKAMEVYKEYGMWNGITVSKVTEHYTKLYWFTQQELVTNWHKFFIRNKYLLLKFINYFDFHCRLLNLPIKNNTKNLFRFKDNFNYNSPKTEYIDVESIKFNKLLQSIGATIQYSNKLSDRMNLSLREQELLELLCKGYTIKMAASEMSIAYKTAEHHLDRIKQKSNINFKSDLIIFYNQNINE